MSCWQVPGSSWVRWLGGCWLTWRWEWLSGRRRRRWACAGSGGGPAGTRSLGTAGRWPPSTGSHSSSSRSHDALCCSHENHGPVKANLWYLDSGEGLSSVCDKWNKEIFKETINVKMNKWEINWFILLCSLNPQSTHLVPRYCLHPLKRYIMFQNGIHWKYNRITIYKIPRKCSIWGLTVGPGRSLLRARVTWYYWLWVMFKMIDDLYSPFLHKRFCCGCRRSCAKNWNVLDATGPAQVDQDEVILKQ